MYYKVIFNDEIIDIAQTPLNCCYYAPLSQLVIRCLFGPDAMGIICDKSGQYYQVEGWKQFPSEAQGVAGTVRLEEVDENTYNQLANVLDDDSAPGDTSLYEELIVEPIPPEENAPVTKTTAQILREEIAELREQNNKMARIIAELVAQNKSEG